MKILAVDTSTQVSTIAIVDDMKVLGEFTINNKKTHSQKLIPLIEYLLNEIDLKINDLDILAATNGPGSFTGLRIGITTIKALSYVVKKPVIGISTLEALAYNVHGSNNLVCPILDARNRNIYAGVYKWEESSYKSIKENLFLSIDEFIDYLKSKNERCVFLGDAVFIYRDYLQSKLGEKCEFANYNLITQRGASVAIAALEKFKNGFTENCYNIEPFYLNKSQAEREYDKKHSLNKKKE